jgi:hypothetical protein
MFDVQVLRRPQGELDEPVLASIAAYYRRVTTTAAPMNRLVAAVMLLTLGAIIAQIAAGDAPAGVGWLSLALAASAIGVAAARTVPSAVRLGARDDPPAQQGELARAVCRQHLFCFGSIATLLVVQLAAA